MASLVVLLCYPPLCCAGSTSGWVGPPPLVHTMGAGLEPDLAECSEGTCVARRDQQVPGCGGCWAGVEGSRSEAWPGGAWASL